MYTSGYIAIGFGNKAGEFDRVEIEDPASSYDQPGHILLIAKGNHFAFYLNGQPLYSTINDLYRSGRTVLYVETGTAAIDNVKIWDLADVANP